jgi:hypothetical protein
MTNRTEITEHRYPTTIQKVLEFFKEENIPYHKPVSIDSTFPGSTLYIGAEIQQLEAAWMSVSPINNPAEPYGTIQPVIRFQYLNAPQPIEGIWTSFLNIGIIGILPPNTDNHPRKLQNAYCELGLRLLSKLLPNSKIELRETTKEGSWGNSSFEDLTTKFYAPSGLELGDVVIKKI